MDYTNIIKLKNRFNLLFGKRNLQEAARVGDLLIDEYRRFKLNNTQKYADDIFEIACVYDEQGILHRSEELYLESARIYKRICGKDANYTFRINNLAIIYSKTGRKEEALNLFKESYRLRFNLLGYRAKVTGESLYNLGNAYYDLCDYERALHYLKQALKTWNLKSTDYIDNLNSIGYTFVAMGDIYKALEQLHAALSLIGEVEGVLSLEYIKSLFYIANLYYENGNYEKAKKYMELFVNITSKVIGNKHPYILKGMERISDSLEGMQDIDRALDYKLRIMELSKEIIGANHLFYSDCLSSTASLFKKKQEYDKAESLLRESMEIRMQLTGAQNIGYLKDLILLSGIHYEKSEYEKAADEITNVINIVENNVGLFNECLIEMIKVFIELDAFELNENEKRDVFEKIYNFIINDESSHGFNWHLFDDLG